MRKKVGWSEYEKKVGWSEHEKKVGWSEHEKKSRLIWAMSMRNYFLQLACSFCFAF